MDSNHSHPIMNIAIFYNPKTNPMNKSYAAEVTDVLDKHGVRKLLNPDVKELSKIDTAIAVGGDGTVLYTANLLAHTRIPILGINFGHRGHLCQVRRDEIEASVLKLIDKNYKIVEKTRIQAEIKKRDNATERLEALNEISIGGINRTVHIDIEIITPEKRLSAQISGDGLIVASRTGSTAYNINAGGSMLLTEALSIVANNAFFESDNLLPITKSLVVPSETVIKIRDLSHNPANLPYAIADGQKSIKIPGKEPVIIKKAKNKNYFIVF